MNTSEAVMLSQLPIALVGLLMWKEFRKLRKHVDVYVNGKSE